VRKLVLAVCVVLGSMFLAVPPAHAAPPPLPPGKAKKVCDTPAAGAVRCHAQIRTDDNLNPLATSEPSESALSPENLRNAYSITTDGTATIAIVDAYGYTNAESDLAKYRKQFGLGDCTSKTDPVHPADPPCFRKLNQAGQPSPLPGDNVSWSQETALDLDMASAICPGCKLLLIQANSNSLDDLSKAVAMAGQLDAHVHAISNSYGADERSWVAPYEQRYNIPGVAVTVSTGDSGYGVQFPASSPHVVAVGGTNLSESNGVWSETVWSGTGSGCSTVFAKPSWQTDKDCGKRTVGDVAAVADPKTGVWVNWTAPGTTGGSCDPPAAGDCSWYVFGGTSVGAPIIAAAYAINGGPANNAADVYSHATALNDVTAGSNGHCKKGSYLCTAAGGYDGPTGLGTPKGTTAFGGGTTS
jgi:subtilase family serine protease